MRSVPSTGQTRVDRASSFEIEFSEPINKEKFLANLFVSPPITGTPRAKWKKNMVTITWPDSLREAVTYRVTLGANLTDRRNNPMIEPATIAFSTGDSLDTGQITGRVIRGDDAAGALEILAYRLGSGRVWHPDSVDFLATTSENGLFDLNFLPPDRFRVVAVGDRNRNHAPNPGEEIGIPVTDIDLTLAADLEPIRLFTTRYDTTTFSIKSGAASPDGAILIALSLPPDTSTWSDVFFFAEDSATGEIIDAQFLQPLRARSSVVTVYADGLEPDRVYRIGVREARDVEHALRSESGIAASAGECYVRWHGPTDTIGPTVSLTSLPVTGVSTDAQWPILIEFDEPPTHPESSMILKVIDSLGQPVPGSIEWADPRRFSFRPESEWPETTLVFAILDSTRITDRFGNRPPPQPFHWKFHPLTRSQLGAVTCLVNVSAHQWASSSPYLEVRAAAGKLAVRRPAPADSVFEWELPSGSWVLSGWIDLDGDRRWSPGSIDPFRFAEPRVLVSDTLHIRERFTLEDIRIGF